MATDVQLVETTLQHFRALQLTNQFVSLTLLPDLGGKISSIRDLRTGREWLWTNPTLPYRQLPYGTSYIQEADTGGWDECFPTVAPCTYPLPPWQNLSLPDHGEIWSQPWPLEHSGDEAAPVLRTEARGVALPYIFQRSVSLSPDAAVLHLNYRVENVSTSNIGFIWSAHPLFAIEPGMRLLLPEGARMHRWLSVPPQFTLYNEEHGWPVQAELDGQRWDLSQIPAETAAIGCKLWSEPLSQGYAALVASDGEFRFLFDPTLVPQIGVWINASAWSGTGGAPYYNLALEPCIGAQDSLAEAIERYHLYSELPTHSVKEWWLEVHLKAF